MRARRVTAVTAAVLALGVFGPVPHTDAQPAICAGAELRGETRGEIDVPAVLRAEAFGGEDDVISPAVWVFGAEEGLELAILLAPNFDAGLSLRNADNFLLDTAEPGAGAWPLRLDVFIPADGLYRVNVSPPIGGGGDYCLAVIPADLLPADCSLSDLAPAGQLTLGRPQDGTLPPFTCAVWELPLEDFREVELAGRSSAFDIVLLLDGPEGRLEIIDDGAEFEERRGPLALEPGAYQVIVASFDPRAEGPYEVEVQEAAQAQPPTTVPETATTPPSPEPTVAQPRPGGDDGGSPLVPILLGLALAAAAGGAFWWWRGRPPEVQLRQTGEEPTGRCDGGDVEWVRGAEATLKPYTVDRVAYEVEGRRHDAERATSAALSAACANPPRKQADREAVAGDIAKRMVAELAEVSGAGDAVRVAVDLSGSSVTVKVQRYRCIDGRWRKHGPELQRTQAHRIEEIAAALPARGKRRAATTQLTAQLAAFIGSFR